MSERNRESRGSRRNPPIIGFAGYSGSGKTTLATEVVARLERKGLRVAVAKHDGHGHYKEAEGTDSGAYRAAGAASVTVITAGGLVIYYRKSAPTLEDWVKRMEAEDEPYDVLVVEGFKGIDHPKIAVARLEEDLAVLDELGPGLLAVACSEAVRNGIPADIRALNVNDPDEVARFVLAAVVSPPDGRLE